MKEKKFLLLCLIPIGILIAGICIAISLKDVNVLEYGLIYNLYQVQIYDKLLNNGKHYVWVTNKVLKFPKTQISFLYIKGNFFSDLKNSFKFNSINGRSKEGIQLNLECSAEIKLLIKDSKIPFYQQLKELYQNYGKNWHLPVSLTIRSEILNEISKFAANNFHKNRIIIADNITQKIKDKLKLFYIELKSFNLMNFNYPSKLQDAIEITEITNQLFLEKQFYKEGKELEKEYKIRNAKLNEKIIIEKQTSDYEYFKIIKKNKGKALSTRYSYYFQMLNSLAGSKLNLTNMNHITYITYLMTLKNSNSNYQTFIFLNLKYDDITSN